MSENAYVLQCMEIWGGSETRDNAISSPGIDAWVYSRPFEGSSAGGDVHYTSLCNAGNIARFCLADVSGHGVSAADIALVLRDQMRKNINRIDQTRFARAINRAFEEASEGSRFATALLATYFAPSDHLIVCNAGHPRPLWWSASRGEWSHLDGELPAANKDAPVRNLPLGIIHPTEYVQFTVPLGVGDLVVIYSDALIETHDADGRQLGEAGLLRVAEGLDATRPESFVPSALAALTALAGVSEFNDDVSVILLHHNGSDPPRRSISERLRALMPG